MSRGRGAKGAPRERKSKKESEEKKRKKEERKGRKEKRERNFLNTWTGALTRYIPMSLSIDDRKYPSQTLVIITQSLKYETNNGELGPYVFFFQLA